MLRLWWGSSNLGLAVVRAPRWRVSNQRRQTRAPHDGSLLLPRKWDYWHLVVTCHLSKVR